MSGIDCRQAETLVARYIKHTLSTDELEEFLDHIEHCSSCYDELETYFIVHEVTQQLDDDSSDSVLDFKKLLEQDGIRVDSTEDGDRVDLKQYGWKPSMDEAEELYALFRKLGI